MKSMIKNTLSLLTVTVVAALCLALVYGLTKDKIAEAEKEERLQSYHSVFDNAEQFDKISAENVKAYNDLQNNDRIVEAYEVLKGGQRIGVVVSALSHNGYGGDIVLTVGVLKDGSISGMTVTNMSETSGLGAECQNPEWTAQFKGKTAKTLSYATDGQPAEDEIDALSGATYTTKAVLEAVNSAADFARGYMGE